MLIEDHWGSQQEVLCTWAINKIALLDQMAVDQMVSRPNGKDQMVSRPIDCRPIDCRPEWSVDQLIVDQMVIRRNGIRRTR